MIELDPFTECPEDANVEMDLDHPFDDGTPQRSNRPRHDHQGIVMVWVFILELEGESWIASGLGPLLNLRVGICLPYRGANIARSRATHNDIDVPFHRSLWAEGWLAWLPYVSVEVVTVDKVFDLVLQVIAFLSIVPVVIVEAMMSVVSVLDSRPQWVGSF
ncbi:hypothetical protein BHM03_00041711 [Ensete ventricosum]|nr:hypothetical protein BHM03_00041711 [Ensete ventricosum]